MRRPSTGPHDPLAPIESIAYASRRARRQCDAVATSDARQRVDVQAGVPMSAQYSCSAVLTSERRSSTGSSLYESAVRRIDSSGVPSGHAEQLRGFRVGERRAQALARRDDRQPERVLVQVVDRRRTVARTASRSGPAKRARRQREVVDDDRMAVEVQQVADAEHRVAGGDAAAAPPRRGPPCRARTRPACTSGYCFAPCSGTMWKK